MATKLTNTWTKPKVQKLKFFKSLFTIIKDYSSGTWQNLPADAVDMIGTLELTDKPGKIGWKLVTRSLADAILNLIIDNNPYIEKEDIETRPLDKSLDSFLESSSYVIDIKFFNKPKEHPLVESSSKLIGEYLALFEFNQVEIENMVARFPSYFVFALSNEWRKNYNYYRPLKDYLETPVDSSVENEQEWNTYRQWLQKQTDEPVFQESFSLRQVFIPLRAYYLKKKAKPKGDKTVDLSKSSFVKYVVDLENHLLNWILKRPKNDPIKIIRGGPGIGKSSFLKMFAARLAKNGQNVLFIPLHRFEIRDDLIDAVDKFRQYDQVFSMNPMSEKEIILIFDGLDELSMQGKSLSEAANSFIREIDRKINNYNHVKIRLRIVMSGRDIIVQENESEFRKEGQIIRLLPYYISEEDLKKDEYSDPKGLLKIDSRNTWWKKYGSISQKGYTGLPNELKQQDLDDITSQPLLNYLVALSFERKKIEFSEKTNLNEIYNDLLEAIHTKSYDGGKGQSATRNLNLEEFDVMLQEVGLASWHGDGRTTTVEAIESHCEESGSKYLLDKFIEGAEHGVTSLLASFYFKQSGKNNKGEKTFEFTHKSFGEYLTAKRLVNEIFDLYEAIEEKKLSFRKGKDEKSVLVQWSKIFGPKHIDADLKKFISNEFQIRNTKSEKEVSAIRVAFHNILSFYMNHGLPLERLQLSTFQLSQTYAFNSESALILINEILGEITKTVLEISDGQYVNLSNLAEGRAYHAGVVRNMTFSHEKLSNATFSLVSASDTQFINSTLNNAIFQLCSMDELRFNKTKLDNFNLSSLIVGFIQFVDCNIHKLRIKHLLTTITSFQEAEIDVFSINESKHTIIQFSDCVLTNFYIDQLSSNEFLLSNCKWENGTFENCDLKKAQFNNCTFKKVIFKNCLYSESTFSKKNLEQIEILS